MRLRWKSTAPALSQGNCTLAVFVILMIAIPQSSLAHNMGEAESSIRERERYLQPVSGEAPAFSLQDPDGKMFALEDFRGKVVILNFLYSRCKEECPLHSVKIAEAQQQIAESSLSDQVQFLSIATDTELGSLTADSMRDHGTKFGLDHGNWKFLFGGIGGERMGIALAEAYGLKFVPTGTGEQMHGVVTFVIDPKGLLRAKFHGLQFDTLNLTVYAAALVHADHAIDSSTTSGEVPSPTGSAAFALKASEWLAILVGLVSVVLLTWVGYGYFREQKRMSQDSEPQSPGSPATPENKGGA